MKNVTTIRRPLAQSELSLDCLVAVSGGGLFDSKTTNEYTSEHTDTSQHDSNNVNSSYSGNDYSEHHKSTGSGNGGNVALGTQGTVTQGRVDNYTVNHIKL